MASRYWVGGTGNWDASTTTNWSATSGGTSGASVPTSADDVFFDAASGTGTVTVTATGNCLSLNFTGYTGTFAGSSLVNVNGNLVLASGMTWTHTSTIAMPANTGSYTITSNGKSITSNFTLGGSGTSTATWALQDAFSTTGTIGITFVSGTFTTNNYAVTTTGLSSSNGNVRTINLGSSTVSINGGGGIDFTTSTNLTFNAGTSSISLSSAGVTFNGGNRTFYNVSFTNTTASNVEFIQGANTFNNLTFTGPATAGLSTIYLYAGQTINGTLSTTGTAGNRRVFLRSDTVGIARTLTINGTPSLTDADFRDLYVIGTAAPISGTRLGNRGGARGITFTSKTVYWATAAGGSWSGTNWAASAGGAVSDDNFPLPQDTATIVNTGLNTSATVTLDSLLASAISGIDMSGRTSVMAIAVNNASTIYGNWTNGSGTSITGGSNITFAGRNTQTITSAGKTFGSSITIDSFGGTVQLADALNIGGNFITVTNGTFTTNGYAVTASALSSTNSNVRAITLGASTVTCASSGNFVDFTTSTNLIFNAGTSNITNSNALGGLAGGGQTFYNVSFVALANGFTAAITGANTFNNLEFYGPSSAGLSGRSFSANQTINGTLSFVGTSAVRRVFLTSSTLGTARTLTANAISGADCDFRDITIAGAAAGSSPTRAGDCGGNTGITFPSPKTVYWNLAGTQDWSATGWCPSSGGTPDINQFPLAQDTAVIDDAGAATQINMQGFNVGSLNFSGRTSAVTFAVNTGFTVYGNITLGSGVTISGLSGWGLSGRGTTTITSAGKTFPASFTIDCISGTVQLADALIVFNLNLNSGTFNAVTYNVTINGTCSTTGGGASANLRMGSGTWTLAGTGTVWSMGTLFTLYCETANIILSNNTTTARTFNGGSKVYNKLTIGGATSISTTTISSGSTFSELASTKTVAHTIDLSATNHTFGAWTVTGTAGNVVTISGSPITISIVGSRVSGVDYLALGSATVSTTSPGEFYAGANSTGGTGFILTAAPTPVTRYWRGGSGTWDATTTTNWSATSGGAGGASVPTSADTVIFDSLSNSTAYTVTCTATQLRCGAITFSGPLTGSVTWAGTAPLAIHDNFTLPATGLTRSYTGAITLSSSYTGRTFTTNGVTIGSSITVYGVNCEWTLGSGLVTSGNILIRTGKLSFGSYSSSATNISVSTPVQAIFDFGSGTITATTAFDFGSTQADAARVQIDAGTYTLVCSGSAPTFTSPGLTFYNLTFTNVNPNSVTISGQNTFNNLYFTGISGVGLRNILFSANQTINGTLTISAGTNATTRHFLQSNTLGTTRTLTCAAFSGTDVDFRDITIAGAAAPVSGTRLGDCKGNSGITFGAGVNKYWNLFTGGNWGDTAWALSSGGAVNANNFPLAQDTAIFGATGLNSAATVTVNALFNIGTVDMSARTSNTMTLSFISNVTIYGNWINGTGTTLLNSSTLTFAGRGSQTITSAGRTFPQPITINTPGGSVTLQDAFVSNVAVTAITLTNGTFNLNGYSVLFSGASSLFSSANSNVRTVAFGSGSVFTIAGGGWDSVTSTNLTITGTGTISCTSPSVKGINSGGASFSGITFNQGGAGQLNINSNTTLYNITNTYSATGATTISLANTTQSLTQFTASGAAGRLLSITGTSAGSPGTLIITGANKPNVDYLSISTVRAFSLTDTWYAGANSVNNGSLGWIFESGLQLSVILELASGADSVSAGLVFSSAINEASSGVESLIGGFGYDSLVAESASGLDVLFNIGTFSLTILEVMSGLDEVFPIGTFEISVSETASGVDSQAGLREILSIITEAASGAESGSNIGTFSIDVEELASGLAATTSSGTFNISIVESSSGEDSVVAFSITNNSVSESASGLEDQSSNITFNLSVSETASGIESLVSQAFLVAILNEAASALENLDVGGTFNIAITETASGLDQPSNTGIFNIAITETSTGSAVLIGRLLWEPIDDQQTPNWTTINTTSSSGFVEIPTP